MIKKTSKTKRIFRNSIMSGLLAAVMCLSSPIMALAGTTGTAADPEKAELTKTLQYADGVGLSVADVTFTFNFTKISKDGSTAAISSMPELGPATVSFSDSDTGEASNGMMKIAKTSGDVLAGIDWDKTGTYVYRVVEENAGFSGLSGETMNYSTLEYDLYIVVAYDSTAKKYYVAQTYTDQTSSSGTVGKGGANTADSDYNFEFTNTYIKQGGSTPGSNALTISKTTAGTGSDPTNEFTFNLIANDSVTGVSAATYTGTIFPGGEFVSLTADGTAETVFTLSDGEYVVFDTLPAGTAFTVSETGANGYVPSYSGTTAAGAMSGSALRGDGLSTGSQIIGTIDNRVDFTNQYDSSLIPTGILSNIGPFLVLLCVIIIAFIAFAVSNRRKADR